MCSVPCIKEPRLFWPYPDFKSQFANFEQASNIKEIQTIELWKEKYNKDLIVNTWSNGSLSEKVEVMTVN